MKSNQSKLSRVKGKVLVVGVDTGKLNHTALLRTRDGGEVRIVEFENSLVGFKKLERGCLEVCKEERLKGIVMGLEPTGHYWQALAYWWEDHVGKLVLINPMHTKRSKEMEDNSPLKSDVKDARVIGGLISEGRFLECHLPRGKFADLRNLMGQRRRCENERLQIINQLSQAIDRVFPELVKCFSRLTTNSCLELMKQYPTPDKIAEEELSKITELLKTKSRGRLREQRAQMIQELARNTIGVKEGKAVIGLEISRLLRNLETHEKQSREIEEMVAEVLEEIPGAKLLLSMKGFGIVTVGSILANTGDLRNYSHPDEVIKLAGLNLYEISSGKHKGVLRISKRGRSELRRILYMAALRLVQESGFKEYYQRLTGRGVKRLVALVAVMRKIVRVVWSMVKHNTKFDPLRLRSTEPIAKVA